MHVTSSPSPNPSAPEGALRLAEYLAVVRRRWWVVALCAVVVCAAAYGFARIQEPTYRSTTRLLIKDPGGVFHTGSNDTFNNDPKRLIETQRQLIRSRPVIQEAASKLRKQGVTEAPDRALEVTSVTNTNLIDVTVSHHSRRTAQLISRQVSAAYLDQYRRQTIDEFATQGRELQQRASSLRANVRDLDSQVFAAQQAVQQSRQPNGAVSPQLTQRLSDLEMQRDRVQAEADLYRNTLDQLRVDSTARAQAVQVVVPASLPTSPASPRPLRSGLLGLAFGLLLGAGSAFLIDYLDDSIRSRDDAERVLGLKGIGLVPRISNWKRPEEARVVAVSEPDSAASEAYRILRTGIRFSLASKGAQVLMVTSPGSREGKSSTAVNLAVVAAEAGQRVILFSADLRRPRVHLFTNLRDDEGLTTYLLGDKPLSQLLRRPRWKRVPPELRVMTCGPTPPNPSEVLSWSRMGDLMNALKDHADLVIVDAPPVLPVSDAVVFATHCDAVLLVIRARKTSRRAARAAIERLQPVQANLIGFVLNDADPDSDELPSDYMAYAPYRARAATANGRVRRGAARGDRGPRPAAVDGEREERAGSPSPEG